MLVKDGDQVQAGQVLVELDATTASADQRQRGASNCSPHERGESQRCRLLQGAGIATERAAAAASTQRDSSQLQAEWRDISAKLPSSTPNCSRRQAEIDDRARVIAKLEATLPLARQARGRLQGLTEQGFMASHAGQDRTRERIEQERDLATQRAGLTEAQAALPRAETPARPIWPRRAGP